MKTLILALLFILFASIAMAQYRPGPLICWPGPDGLPICVPSNQGR